MKKILAMVLSLIMLFSVMSFGASAYTINKDDAEIGAGDIFGTTAVYFNDAVVTAGQSVTVDIVLESNPGMTKIDISLELPEGITVSAVENGDMGTASVSGNVITVTSTDVLSEDGCIAKVTLAAVADIVGEKTVKLSVSAENDGEAVNVNGSSCVVNVSKKTDDVVPGDCDGDGDADTVDLAALKLYLVNVTTEIEAGADANGDGFITTIDLAKLKRMLAGLE